MGALGLGDGKKRFVPTLMVFFEDKRVIDVSCGDQFTVVIAEVETDGKKENKVEIDVGIGSNSVKAIIER